METSIELKEIEKNPHYQAQRQKGLCNLTNDMIDAPIVGLVNGFNEMACCFTLQSCYGHFVCNGQNDPHNLEPLPVKDTITEVEYRMAYIAICIENSASGRWLFETLREIPTIDPENVQFCCAEWFWKRQVNSYVLQVEPDRFKRRDKAVLDYTEALYIEKVRNAFFDRLDKLVETAGIR